MCFRPGLQPVLVGLSGFDLIVLASEGAFDDLAAEELLQVPGQLDALLPLDPARLDLDGPVGAEKDVRCFRH